jgi:hypothetical protein
MLAVRLQLEAMSGDTVLPISTTPAAKTRSAPVPDEALPDAAQGPRLP